MNPLVQSTKEFDWSKEFDQLAFAYGGPVVTGTIKYVPEDFLVSEQMSFEPSGEGEHIWLWVRKCKQNTDQVAKGLARYCNVAYRDVAYSGLKDYFAVTEQWFSVWLPRGEQPDWDLFVMPGVEILKSVRHSRKLQRGTHSSNRFTLLIRNVGQIAGQSSLQEKVQLIQKCGVPNYFGAQRFGRDAGNMNKASTMLSGERKIKDRNLRGILMSAARSWLFNSVVSERIAQGSWRHLFPGEPANLDSSQSFFTSLISTDENDDSVSEQNRRLLEMDIHPTAPMWGDANPKVFLSYPDLHEFEKEIIDRYGLIADGLRSARVTYQRRAIRMRVPELATQSNEDQLTLSFTLNKGQYATSVLREIVADSNLVPKVDSDNKSQLPSQL